MSTIINSLASTPVVELSFTWSPNGSYATPVGNLVVPKASVNTLLTFTASTQIYNPTPGTSVTIIEYRWDFGDGTLGYGNGATHTYTIANLQAACTLRVTDSYGGRWYARQQLYLS